MVRQNRWQTLDPVWNQLQAFQGEMNRLFDRWGDNGAPALFGARTFPAMNVWEEGDSVFVEAELPGQDLKDLEITVTGGNELTIKGGRKQVTPDNPGVVKCAQYMRSQIVQFGGLDGINAFKKGFGSNANDPFYIGQIVTQINGEWLPTFIPKYKPDLQYGVGYMPYDETAPQAKQSGNIGTNLIIIPKDGKHQQESWDVIAFANTPEPNLALAKGLGNTPQVLAAVPRPTRPRSWCSCASPMRSAFSITMSVAFGTSTPTSITVVATSSWIRPALKASIAWSRAAAGMRPCTSPTRPGNSSARAR